MYNGSHYTLSNVIVMMSETADIHYSTWKRKAPKQMLLEHLKQTYSMYKNGLSYHYYFSKMDGSRIYKKFLYSPGDLRNVVGT